MDTRNYTVFIWIVLSYNCKEGGHNVESIDDFDGNHPCDIDNMDRSKNDVICI
mgnify:FL=1